MKTLDERIKADLADLLTKGIISNAKAINDSGLLTVSTKGMPGHYCGDRDAKTVFVNLNPGNDAVNCDNELAEREKLMQMDRTSLISYIDCYNIHARQYGVRDRERIDYFDLKQAAFLAPWKDCGIGFPKSFPQTNDKEILKDAKQNSLTQHLQLELLPYASNKFQPNSKNIDITIPYLETLFDEIFRVDRKYVIFGSRFFIDIFKLLKKKSNDIFGVEFVAKKESKDFSIDSKVSFTCNVVKLKYKGQTMSALVANSFPNQALSKALELQYKYGKECFEFYLKNS